MNIKKIVLAVIIVSLVVGGGIGFYLYNKPHTNYQQSSASFVGAADDFLVKARTDEASFSTEFLNRAVEVEGTVTEAGNISFTLGEGLICTLDPNIEQEMPQVGTLVKVKGRMVGIEEDILSMEVICNLDQCAIIKD